MGLWRDRGFRWRYIAVVLTLSLLVQAAALFVQTIGLPFGEVPRWTN